MPLAGHLWTLELLGSLIITGPIVMVTVGLIGLKVLQCEKILKLTLTIEELMNQQYM